MFGIVCMNFFVDLFCGNKSSSQKYLLYVQSHHGDMSYLKVLVVLMKLPWQHVLPEGVGCADEVAMAACLT